MAYPNEEVPYPNAYTPHIWKTNTMLYVHFPRVDPYTDRYMREWIGNRCQLGKHRSGDGSQWYVMVASHFKELLHMVVKEFGACWTTSEYSTKVRCNEACRNAEGEDCVCSCLGQFHSGRGGDSQDWRNVSQTMQVSEERVNVVRFYLRDVPELCPF